MVAFLICFFACIVGAVCGIGGGVIIKPVLDAVSGMEIAAINFLSGCTVLCMTAYSVLRSRLSGCSRIEPHTSVPLAAGASLGGVLGKSLFQALRGIGGDTEWICALQAACLLFMIVGTLLYTIEKRKISTRYLKNRMACIVVGSSLGLLSAFLGIGGGPINLVVLFYFFSMDTKTAAENSLYIILFSQITSLVSSLLTNTVPAFSFQTLGWMTAGGTFGGICGRYVNQRLDEKAIDRLFIALMLGMIALNLWNLFQFLK